MSKLISTLINELTYGAVVGLPHAVAVGLEFESWLLPIFGQNFLVYLFKKWGDEHRIRTRVTSLRNNVVTTALLQVMLIEFISIFFLSITCPSTQSRGVFLTHPFSSLSPRHLLLFLTLPPSLQSRLGVSSSSSPAPFSSVSPRRLLLTGMPIAKILGVSSWTRSAQGRRKRFDRSDVAHH
jgi:hypothetical protein